MESPVTFSVAPVPSAPLKSIENCNVKRRDDTFFYSKKDPLLWILFFWGLFPITRNNKGQFEVRWASTAGLYSILVVGSLQLMNLLTLRQKLLLIFSHTLSFDAIAYNLSVMVTQGLIALPVISLWESRKLVTFYNNLATYEIQFNQISSTPLKKLSRTKIHSIAIALFFVIGACVFVVGRRISLTMLVKDDRSYTDSAAFAFFVVVTKFLVLLGLMAFWRANNLFLAFCSSSLIEEIEKCKWILDNNLHELMVLWQKLYNLYGCFGRAVGITYSLYFLTIFFFYLSSIYMSVSGIVPNLGKSLIYIILVGAVMPVFIECGCETVNKIGDQFRSRLIVLLSDGKDVYRDKQLMKFIKMINSYRPMMSLGGFFNLERNINISMYSSIITYFIIIIQFKGDYGQNSGSININSSRATET